MHIKAAPFFPEFFGHPKERKRDHRAKRGFSRICFLVRLWEARTPPNRLRFLRGKKI